MNYSETLEYLYSHLPMFSSQGKSAIKPGLQNTINFCRVLGNPQNKFQSVHVGGTNGKGSTSHMLAAILQTAGYKTGLYTSPHLKDFRERIRINGKMIPEKEVIQFVEAQCRFIEKLEPSFFEVTVAMAFHYFAKNQVDIAIIEVGLGGRLDSTNVINPLFSIITNIGYDHMDILGNTLPLIASEKAGIIKAGIPVIIGERQEETAEVFSKKASECNSQLVFASDEWIIEERKEVKGEKVEGESAESQNSVVSIPEFLSLTVKSSNLQINPSSNYLLDLTGTYQLKNLAGVLSAVKQLRLLGYSISDEEVKSALKQVKMLTGLMGRWQTLQKNPLLICDTGHNEDGIMEVLKNIELTPHEKLHIVIGMVKDKDISKILQILPKQATYYFCQSDIPRAKPVKDLQQEAKMQGLNGEAYPTVAEALKAAKDKATEKDLIFVGGSTFVVADLFK